MEWCTLACLKGQVGPNPCRKMVELKAAQLLHQSALRCPETTALVKFEWLEGALKLSRNLYALNPGLLGQKPINGLARFGLPKIDPQRHYLIPIILYCLLQRYD